MNVIVVRSTAAFHREAAVGVLSRVHERPRLVVGLPAGAVPEGMYRELVAAASRGEADLRGVVVFALDEYVGLSPDDPRSFDAYLPDRFLSHVEVGGRHLLDGAARNLQREAARYEA